MKFSSLFIVMLALISTAAVFVLPAVKNKANNDDYKKIEAYSDRY